MKHSFVNLTKYIIFFIFCYMIIHLFPALQNYKYESNMFLILILISYIVIDYIVNLSKEDFTQIVENFKITEDGKSVDVPNDNDDNENQMSQDDIKQLLDETKKASQAEFKTSLKDLEKDNSELIANRKRTIIEAKKQRENDEKIDHLPSVDSSDGLNPYTNEIKEIDKKILKEMGEEIIETTPYPANTGKEIIPISEVNEDNEINDNSNDEHKMKLLNMYFDKMTETKVLNAKDVKLLKKKMDTGLMTVDEVIARVEQLDKETKDAPQRNGKGWFYTNETYRRPQIPEGCEDGYCERSYNILSPEHWQLPMPHPPVCTGGNSIDQVQPVGTQGYPLDLKEWENARRITA